MNPTEIKAELRGQRDLPQVRAVLALIAGQRDQDQGALIGPGLSSDQRHYFAGAVSAMTGLLDDLERCLDPDQAARG